MRIATPKTPEQASCPSCWKAESLCICENLRQIPSKLKVLVLQHPRESKNPKTSARILSLSLGDSAVHRVGLSWRSLNHALGVGRSEAPHDWAVLYLGTQKDSAPISPPTGPFEIRDRKGKFVPLRKLKGIVLLDGNWKQSKTLWWRNAWLLKLNRVLLNPTTNSRFGTLRKQPRERCLSTLEAGAESLLAMGETAASENLIVQFESFLGKLRRPGQTAVQTP